MNRVETLALLERAAAATRERIRVDAGRVSPARIRPLLEAMLQGLFDPELNWLAIVRSCGVRDHSRSELFRRELGVGPAAYLREARLEVAARLLREAELGVQEVALLTGFASTSVFGTAFRRWAGTPPTRYRRDARDAGDGPAAEHGPMPVTPASWRRFVDGQLEKAEVQAHLRHFLDRYPEARHNLLRELLDLLGKKAGGAARDEARAAAAEVLPSLRALVEREDLERLAAELVWEDVRGLDGAGQLDFVRGRLGPFARAFFFLLGDKSREEGRRDAQRGIQVARLALETAVALEGAGSDEGYAVLTGRAWAWLGNAKRIAGDFQGAEQAFVAAERRLPAVPRCAEEFLAVGVASSMWALARQDQQRFDEALALSGRAIAALRASVDEDELARALVTRALTSIELGSFDPAVADLQEARNLGAARGPSYVTCLALFYLARVHIDQGDLDDAARSARESRTLLERTSPGAGREAFDWLEARIATASGDLPLAETLLRTVRAGLISRGMLAQAAVASLDLAHVVAEQGRNEEAALLAAEILPALQAIDLGPNVAAALRLVASASAAGMISVALLEDARSELRRADTPSTRRLRLALIV